MTRNAVSDLITTARDYTKAIATVGAISGATKDEMVVLNEEARRLGESTAFSATSAAEGMISFSRAGFTVKETLEAAEPTLNLAVAANAELGRTAELASIALRTYGFEASRAGEVTDIIAATFTTSQTTLESFAESFKQLGPAARSMGIPFTEASAVIGILGDQGLRGTDATTAFRTSLARLASSPKPVRDELKRLNLEVFDAEGKFIGLANIIEELEKRYKSYTDEQRQASISFLFGNRALSQANILLNAQRAIMTETGPVVLRGSEAIKAYTKQLEDAGSQVGEFTKKIADVQLDSFEGDITLLKSSTEGLQLAIFDLVEDELRSLVQATREVVLAFTALTKGEGDIAEFLERNSTLITVLAKLLGVYTASVVANTISLRINAIAHDLNTGSIIKGSAVTKTAAILKLAYSNAIGVLTGKMRLLTAISTTFNEIGRASCRERV